MSEKRDRTPNLVLRRIREEVRKESRSEFARAMEEKARDLKPPENVACTERTVARFEDEPPVRKLTRQEVLRCVCGGLIAAGLLHLCDRCGRGQRVIQALSVATSDSADHLGAAADSLDELVSYYSQTLGTLSPAGSYDNLLSVRSYAGSVLDRAGPSAPQHSRILVATGWLSNLLAVTASDMGDQASALVWCSDAERRSQEAGHPELAAWAAFTRAVIAYYHGQASRAVTLARRGQQAAPMGTAAHVKLAAQEMRAWARLGDVGQMTQAKQRAAQAMTKLPSGVATSGVFSISLAEDPPYTATSLLLVNQLHDAVAAANCVIDTAYPADRRDRGELPSGYARSLLILGLAQIGLGRVEEAVAAGQAALASSCPVWPTLVLAGKLDQVLTRRFADAAETAHYHARYQEAVSHTTGRPRQLTASGDRG